MRIHDNSISLVGVLLGVALAASGCSKGEDVQLQNQGRLCVFPSDPGGSAVALDTTPRDYVANEVLFAAVLFPGCFSGSCTTDRHVSCTVEQRGNSFVVNATASYHATGDTTCTTDCAILAGGCGTPAVPAGTFTFEYAGDSVDLVVPSTVPAPCAGMVFGQ